MERDSPNSPFLGSVSTSFSLFLLSEQLFVYFSPTFFFWKRFSHRFKSGFWIPNFSGFEIPDKCGFWILVHWIPDSSIKICWIPDSGFCYTRRKDPGQSISKWYFSTFDAMTVTSYLSARSTNLCSLAGQLDVS